jgi:hydrogenase-4 component F
LTASHPALGWALVAGVVAIAGLPPFGVFTSEFLVVSSTFARQPLLAIPLAAGLLVGFGALLLRLHHLAFGPPSPNAAGRSVALDLSLVPVWLHLILALIAGIYLPPPVVAWFQSVARLLG